MARIDPRMRLLGALLARNPVAALPEEKLLAMQQRRIPHTPLTDALLGGLPADVDTRTEFFSVPGGSGSEVGAGAVAAAGATGTVPVKIYRPVREYGVLPLLVFFHGGGFVTGSHRGTGGRRHPRTASPHSSRPSDGRLYGMPTRPGSRSPGTARAAISRR